MPAGAREHFVGASAGGAAGLCDSSFRARCLCFLFLARRLELLVCHSERGAFLVLTGVQDDAASRSDPVGSLVSARLLLSRCRRYRRVLLRVGHVRGPPPPFRCFRGEGPAFDWLLLSQVPRSPLGAMFRRALVFVSDGVPISVARSVAVAALLGWTGGLASPRRAGLRCSLGLH